MGGTHFAKLIGKNLIIFGEIGEPEFIGIKIFYARWILDFGFLIKYQISNSPLKSQISNPSGIVLLIWDLTVFYNPDALSTRLRVSLD